MKKKEPLPVLPRVNMWVRIRRVEKDWVVNLGKEMIACAKYKEPTVSLARHLAREHAKKNNCVVELMICDRFNKVHEKNTYPRKYDSRKYRG